jgi:hypothetical protein
MHFFRPFAAVSFFFATPPPLYNTSFIEYHIIWRTALQQLAQLTLKLVFRLITYRSLIPAYCPVVVAPVSSSSP